MTDTAIAVDPPQPQARPRTARTSTSARRPGRPAASSAGSRATAAAASLVDVVVPVFNALEDVQACLAALERCTDGLAVRVIVVNDGSDAATTAWLRSHCSGKALFHLIEHAANAGFTRAVNSGLRASTAPYVVSLNSDTVVTRGWLPGLVRCMESSPTLGIVGPLSNAASWQNVPDLLDAGGQFAINPLPPGLDADGMAALVGSASARSYPRSPFVNGFCFMIRRAVIERIGLMDEENFPVGYGEENDFCVRAAEAGFELAIADDVYVFHAKSRSFGHERRKVLSKQGTETLRRKHGRERFDALAASVRDTAAMDVVRQRIRALLPPPAAEPSAPQQQAAAAAAPLRPSAAPASQPAAARASAPRQQALAPVPLLSMRVLFLLPVKGHGGGVHSVVQEVSALRRLGLKAHVGVRAEHLQDFLKNYSDIADASALFAPFRSHDMVELAGGYDVVVGTIYTSMRLLRRIADVHPHVLPAYYVQDYEPMFFEPGTPDWEEARASYTLVPQAFAFAKTDWIIRTVAQEHGMRLHKVAPSIDHAVYRPAAREEDGRIVITAMVRPQTPRRGAARTMRLLSRLHSAHAGRLAFHIFGCPEDRPDFQALQRDFPYTNHGTLTRTGVAGVLGASDLFLDLSDYQAFGRTALEAMACACAVVVPRAGGADEFAVDGDNALVVDTLDEEATFQAVSALVGDPARLARMRHAGLLTAARYSLHAAAVSECVPLAQALADHRATHPRIQRPALVLLPAVREDGEPTRDAHARLLVPYGADAMRREWRIDTLAGGLPDPGSAHVAVFHGIPHRITHPELQDWVDAWKPAGRIVLDVDDMLAEVAQAPAGTVHADLAAKARLLLAAADVVTAPHAGMATAVQALAPQVQVVPDVLDEEAWQLGRPRDHSRGPFARQPDAPLRIGYLADVDDPDAGLLAPLMRELQERHAGRLVLEVIGAFQDRPVLFGERVGYPRRNDPQSHIQWLQQRVHWDMALAVWDGQPAGERAARLRLMELAALDVPVFFIGQAPLPPTDPQPVYQGTPREWLATVDQMVADPAYRAAIVQPYPQAARAALGAAAVGRTLAGLLQPLLPHR